MISEKEFVENMVNANAKHFIDKNEDEVKNWLSSLLWSTISYMRSNCHSVDSVDSVDEDELAKIQKAYEHCSSIFYGDYCELDDSDECWNEIQSEIDNAIEYGYKCAKNDSSRSKDND